MPVPETPVASDEPIILTLPSSRVIPGSPKAKSVYHALKKITNGKAKICCTRKTLPGLRYLQKKAVLAGGGVNNRYNLESEIFVKDNHHIDKVKYKDKHNL